MTQFKVIDRFKGAEVHITEGVGIMKIKLDGATVQQLKMLYDIGHEAVERSEEKPKQPDKAK